MADVLEKILDAKRRSLAAAKEQRPLAELEHLAKDQGRRDFFSAVSAPGRINLICEMKRRSPSAGKIREEFDPALIGRAYEQGGAAALSVLTEKDFFNGELSDLAQARSQCALPALRKDFIFDPYQLAEARAFGADAVLLIAEALSPSQLKDLTMEAKNLGMEPLVEVFLSDSVPAALNSGARLIGINSRNLRTLDMKPDNIAYITRLIPKDRVVVAESGIKTSDELQELEGAGARAALIGESLLKQTDLSAAVKNLLGGSVERA